MGSAIYKIEKNYKCSQIEYITNGYRSYLEKEPNMYAWTVLNKVKYFLFTLWMKNGWY